MTAISLEERVAALEAEVARLKQERAAETEPKTPWWEKIAGTFAGSEDYEEAMRLGRAWREAQRPEWENEDKNG